jgi:hypothetical protein
VGPGKDQTQEYNILFPLPGGEVEPTRRINVQIGRFYFVDKTGVERFWLSGPKTARAWIPSSARSFPHGVITSVDEIAKIQSYLNTAILKWPIKKKN